MKNAIKIFALISAGLFFTSCEPEKIQPQPTAIYTPEPIPEEVLKPFGVHKHFKGIAKPE